MAWWTRVRSTIWCVRSLGRCSRGGRSLRQWPVLGCRCSRCLLKTRRLRDGAPFGGSAARSGGTTVSRGGKIAGRGRARVAGSTTRWVAGTTTLKHRNPVPSIPRQESPGSSVPMASAVAAGPAARRALRALQALTLLTRCAASTIRRPQNCPGMWNLQSVRVHPSLETPAARHQSAKRAIA
jgi:hypothetical protein